jgi:hypothetical protein
LKRLAQFNLRLWIGRGVLVLFLSLFTASVPAQTNLIIGYDAASDNLPEEVTNKNVFNAGGPAAAVYGVSGGIFHMAQVGCFDHFRSNFDFSAYTNIYVLDASVDIVGSDYRAVNGVQRSGHYFEAYDSAGNGFELGISSGGVTLNTDSVGAVGQGIPFTPFNSTDGFHDYQVVIRGGEASLFIDGKSFGSTAFIPGEPLGPEFGFGNLAGALGTESGAAELRNVSLTSTVFVPSASVNSPNSCSGEPVMLAATTSAINPSFSWNPGGATNASITVSPTVTTTYTVTVTDGPTGLTNCASGTVTVSPLPTISVNSTNSYSNAPVLLTATTSAGNPSYLWSPGDATNASIIVSPTATTTYTVFVTDGVTGCVNSGFGTVTVIPSSGVPPEGALYAAGIIDAGPDLRLKLIGLPGASYALNWTHSLTPEIIWLPLATNIADTNGWVFFTNTPSTGPADFYRARPWP